MLPDLALAAAVLVAASAGAVGYWWGRRSTDARSAVVEGMRDGFAVLDGEDRVVDANPAATRLLGTDPVGRPLTAALPDGEVVDLHEHDDRTTGALAVAGERRRYVEVEVTPLAGERRLVTLRDVTERHSVERRYRRLFENVSDLVTVVDAGGRVRYQSPSVERVLGYDREAVRDRPVVELVHPEDRERVERAVERLVSGTEPEVEFRYRLRDADGDYRTLASVGVDLLSDPFVEGVVVTSRDVTDRVARERDLERKNERLEEFAGVVSHDLRNPLSVARGRLTLAREGRSDEHLEETARALDRMEAIVEDVLALAREGEAVTDPEPVALRAVAERAWEGVDTAAATLAVADGRRLVADEDRLLRALENLYRNAVEHAGPGVRVEVGAVADGFYVADDGPGIPERRRDAVFETGHTTADDGTGFGLAVVRRVVEAHGWEVAVTEADDGGARFEVRGVETPVRAG
jgi:PAS domain S-box-containing protein